MSGSAVATRIARVPVHPPERDVARRLAHDEAGDDGSNRDPPHERVNQVQAPANIAAEYEYSVLKVCRPRNQQNKEDGKPAAGFGSRIHALSPVGKRYRAKFARVNANLRTADRKASSALHPRMRSRTPPVI
jgi:hypothetical protein